MSSDITLLKGLTLMSVGFSRVARLYYFEGNFYQPLEVDGCEIGRIKRAIRQFLRDNTELVRADRTKPGYKTLVELFDQQMEGIESE